MTAISGHTDLTIEELHFIEHAGEAIQRLRLVLDTSRDLLGIMDEILTYAKAEAGKSDITLTTVELAHLVNRVSSAMQPMLLKNGNRLRVTVAGAPLVTIDEGKIFHIVLNLVSNAWGPMLSRQHLTDNLFGFQSLPYFMSYLINTVFNG